MSHGHLVAGQVALEKLWQSYNTTTASKLKVIDSYLVAAMIAGVVQFLYCVLVGTYPYNAFLAGFGTSIATFVLTANLRMQLSAFDSADADNKPTSPERAIADFCFCHCVLFLFVVHFIG